MNQKELKDLIDFLVEKDITEFELERGDVKVRVKRGTEPVLIPAVAAPPQIQVPVAASAAQPTVGSASSATAAAPPAAPAEPAEEAGLHIVKSPIVGTYYEAPSPGSPPFIKVGDEVTAGQVLCIVEAMKLMNEIESDVAGEVVKILVTNNQPIEYGQSLFAIRPR
jgi:acetyl-CoA carboxylase biotin carboxyl carrier protein